MASSLSSTLAEDLRELHREQQLRPPTATDLSALSWETRQNAFIALLSTLPNKEAAGKLRDLVAKRKDVRRANKEQERLSRPEDIGLLPEQARKEEDEHRRQFIEAVADELRQQNAPRGLSNARLLLKDKTACLQAIDFLLTRHKSRLKTNSSFLHRLSAQQQQHASPSVLSSSFSSSIDSRTARARRSPPSSSRDKAIENRPAWVSPLGDTSIDDEDDYRDTSTSFSTTTTPRRTQSTTVHDHHPSESAVDGQGEPSTTTTTAPIPPLDASYSSLASSGEYVSGSATIEIASSARRRPRRPRDSSVDVSSAAACTISGGSSTSAAMEEGRVAGSAGGFYCSQLMSLEDQVRQLKAENGRLQARLEESQALHEAMVGREVGSVDERRVAMMQAQHIQLQRQVKCLQGALGAQSDLGAHLCSILTTLDENVGAMVRLGQAAGGEGAAGGGGASRLSSNSTNGEAAMKDGGNQAPMAAAAASGAAAPGSAVLPKVGPNFWLQVHQEVQHLKEQWKQVQRATRMAQTRRIMVLPQEAKVMLRKPSDLTTSSGTTVGVEREDWDGGGSLRRDGQGEMELDADKVWRLERGLRDLVSGLERLQADLNAHDYRGAVDPSVQAVRDSARALLIDVGYLGLVVPVHSRRRGDDVGKEIVDGFHALLRQPPMKASEVAEIGKGLERVVMAERNALSSALISSTEELVVLRSGIRRHIGLLEKLVEGMRDAWEQHEDSISISCSAMKALMEAYVDVRDSPDAQRLTHGQAGEGSAHLMRTLAAYQDDLMSLLESCDKSHAEPRTRRVLRLWEKYEMSLGELLHASYEGSGDKEGE